MRGIGILYVNTLNYNSRYGIVGKVVYIVSLEFCWQQVGGIINHKIVYYFVRTIRFATQLQF
jgi:hypothetical protein